MDWVDYVTALLFTAWCLLCVLLTIVTLPGTYLILFGALLVAIFQPDLLSWWMVAGLAMGVVLAELAEFASSAAGAAAGGASKHGLWGATIGGILGAIVGTVLIPIWVVGTLVGGVIGAGLLAGGLERFGAKRTWAETGRAASGAVAGRFFATVVKGIIALAMAITASVAAFLP